MGLTMQSTGAGVLEGDLRIERATPDDMVIALAGNPNVGKSTVFNGLTGLHQHTGNWPGKTVASAKGTYKHKDKNFIMVDIPGTYSLLAHSAEEAVARDFVCFGRPDATVVVADATCLERNLNLVLQILEITDRVVVCVNLMDEAARKNIHVDCAALSRLLGVPVIAASARGGHGLPELMDAVYETSAPRGGTHPLRVSYESAVEQAIAMALPQAEAVCGRKISARWAVLRLLEGDATLEEGLRRRLEPDPKTWAALGARVEAAQAFLAQQSISPDVLRDRVVSRLVITAEGICNEVVSCSDRQYNAADRKLDRILTSKCFGIPIMLGLLGLVFWLTIAAANVPSAMLAGLFAQIESGLNGLLYAAGAPPWLQGVLVEGAYRTLAWVVAVMLPPMAIFFPLFTLLEDLGYLPRVAFNLDNFFRKAGAHGKQALTMCMACQCLHMVIIDSTQW